MENGLLFGYRTGHGPRLSRIFRTASRTGCGLMIEG